MLETIFDIDQPQTVYNPIRSSPEVRACRNSFRNLISAAAGLAALSANLVRWAREFFRTEHRVRALENVILPEIRKDLATMKEYLDNIDQEEVIRVRFLRNSV